MSVVLIKNDDDDDDEREREFTFAKIVMWFGVIIDRSR